MLTSNHLTSAIRIASVVVDMAPSALHMGLLTYAYFMGRSMAVAVHAVPHHVTHSTASAVIHLSIIYPAHCTNLTTCSLPTIRLSPLGVPTRLWPSLLPFYYSPLLKKMAELLCPSCSANISVALGLERADSQNPQQSLPSLHYLISIGETMQIKVSVVFSARCILDKVRL